MRREDIACACRPQRFPEIEIGFERQLAGAFDDRESGMAFVHMADLDFGMERFHHPPAADAEHNFLHQTKFGTAAVEFRGDAAIQRAVKRIIGVEQIQSHPADIGLPDAQLDDAARQFEADPEPAVLGQDHRFDRQRRGFVVGVEFLLHSRAVDQLTEIAFLIQKADTDDRDVEIAR